MKKNHWPLAKFSNNYENLCKNEKIKFNLSKETLQEESLIKDFHDFNLTEKINSLRIGYYKKLI